MYVSAHTTCAFVHTSSQGTAALSSLSGKYSIPYCLEEITMCPTQHSTLWAKTTWSLLQSYRVDPWAGLAESKENSWKTGCPCLWSAPLGTKIWRAWVPWELFFGGYIHDPQGMEGKIPVIAFIILQGDWHTHTLILQDTLSRVNLSLLETISQLFKRRLSHVIFKARVTVLGTRALKSP